MLLPDNVEFIIEKFNKNNFSAYAVGGCVRDTLLSKTPTDWDICTDAMPEEIIRIFEGFKIIKTGIKHGTVTLILNSSPYEITTFRTDGDYVDSRHPKAVSFVKNLADDLKRRDFTINAIAYNHTDGIVDLYGGQQDLDNRLIRCVGDAKERFSEDALRIMRAIRFSATLGFSVEEKTKKAIFSLKDNLKNISKERINTEFSKIIMSDSLSVYTEFKEVFELFLKNAKMLDEAFAHKLTSLPKDLSLRLAYLLLFLNYTEKNAEDFLKNLRYSTATVKQVSQIIKNYTLVEYDSIKALRYSIKDADEYSVSSVLKIKNIPSAISMLEEIKNKNLCCNISDLDISGNDLILLGIDDGIKIGQLLNKLLEYVIEEKTKNKKEELLKLTEELI